MPTTETTPPFHISTATKIWTARAAKNAEALAKNYALVVWAVFGTERIPVPLPSLTHMITPQ